MKTFKLASYANIREILDNLPNEFKVNLSESSEFQRLRIIDFLAGLAYQEGSMKKINAHEYIITLKGVK